MRALKLYSPKRSLCNSNSNQRRLIYHPLPRSKSQPPVFDRMHNQHMQPVQQKQQYHSITNRASNSKLTAMTSSSNIYKSYEQNRDKNCSFFFKMQRDSDQPRDLEDIDQQQRQQLSNSGESRQQVGGGNGSQSNVNGFCNFNCLACNKWFFCKRVLEHELECPVINKFNGAGDKADRTVTNNATFNLGNDNILRHSLVCYLCGNRYSFRSIVYHEERCCKKFKRFFTEPDLPKKPVIEENVLLAMVTKQNQVGNTNFTQIDAFNEIMFKESLKNDTLLKSRLKYY